MPAEVAIALGLDPSVVVVDEVDEVLPPPQAASEATRAAAAPRVKSVRVGLVMRILLAQ
jgi:hypothetical protein